MENQTVTEGKTIAIISYITWFGTLIAFIINNDKRNSFAAFHIRQMVGLSLFSLANIFVVGLYVNSGISGLISLILFVFWIIGFIGAIQGEEKKIPLLGDLFQEWFKGIA
ncbi:MAG: hypothetical protein GQ540_02570 [Lutibacter sp.]|uniref:DUF4870 domain-containing protein n=1 Tax=Lutibacter sp. TaxID=1925666 RepID=UPI0019FD0641|nr:hypothetical protein [Lutibacter sp.]NOR27392.1 hypothetical protein [Lutibacter sp.]